tara:strand:+ start:1567 stop:1773 length:207 start_codon:yes stop_codon:yes gene_type:complete
MLQATLIGKSKKGKQRVKMHGEVWNVIENSNSPGSLLLKSLDRNDSRWVSICNDPDFDMEISKGQIQG